ncbi:unnamed protein product [Trifolium pratense]|uniref:Uncharacterized protein n=1 Tax=Trifolium pratense TaxID=57577 RepID=A0ACB0IK17_TRIPR|nr:unnamed protein product [Trifolium pratense]
MEEMSRNLVPPKNIMSTLKDRDPNNKTTAKQLYNLSHRLKLKMRASMTEMQHLSKRLVETGYFFKHRTVVADGSEHERLKTADVSVKNDIRNQLRLIAYPETTSVKPPLQKAKTKGARKKKSVRVTRSTSRDKSRWEHVDDHIAATQASQSQPTKSKPSTSQTVPERVVVQLSNMERCGASRTCFPLRGKPPSDTSDLDSKIICIGALADHFVLVRLKVGCPIPPTAHQWKNSCSEEAAEWEPMFLDRMQKFGELLTIERAGDDLVTIGKGSKDDPLEL